ncbi:hypothetical protein G7Y79_00002g006550 [Physcia stellaris]|nr:hypothetical protein G7Y79_00002g006550 [Physcia stellaris]
MPHVKIRPRRVHGIVTCLLYLDIFTQAAYIPSVNVLKPSTQSFPFNLTLPHNVNVNTSLGAPPPVPFRFPFPNSNMALVFTSFDAVLPSTSVLSTFIDALLFAVDGLAIDARQPTPYGRPLRWQQGAAELSILPINSVNYIILANTIGALEAAAITFGSVRNGMYATRFDIYVANTKIGTGRLASRRPSPRPPRLEFPASETNTTAATARRALTAFRDPMTFRIADTPIALYLSDYRGQILLPDALYLLLHPMLTAAGAIRDTGADTFIGRSWTWRHADLQLALYPKVIMSWRNMATAAKGMKDWMMKYGGKDTRFEVDMEMVGSLGLGRLGRAWS